MEVEVKLREDLVSCFLADSHGFPLSPHPAFFQTHLEMNFMMNFICFSFLFFFGHGPKHWQWHFKGDVFLCLETADKVRYVATAEPRAVALSDVLLDVALAKSLLMAWCQEKLSSCHAA